MSSRIVLSGGESEDRRNAGISSAVHDLKAPLAIITGYVNLLIAGQLGEVNSRQLRALRDICASSRRLEHRISQLLLFGAQRANRLTLTFEHADLKPCLSAIHECWLPAFQQKGIEFECRLSHAPLSFEFDGQKLAQLVSNLLENALRLPRAGGLSRSRRFRISGNGAALPSVSRWNAGCPAAAILTRPKSLSPTTVPGFLRRITRKSSTSFSVCPRLEFPRAPVSD